MRYANVMSTVAVFLSLTGGAYAVTKLDDNSVDSRHIKTGAVRGVDIASGAVTPSDMAGEAGRTVFTFRDTKVRLSSDVNNPTKVAELEVRPGEHLITAQVIAQPNTSAGGALCRVMRGPAFSDSALIAFGKSTGGTTNLAIDGVAPASSVAKVVLYCNALGPGDVDLVNARVTAVAVYNLKITDSGDVK